ncbi:MAG: protein translocase subunit SecD [Patescibacteria group bacterium]
MRRNFWIGFVLILATIGLAFYISLPSTTSFLGRSTTIRQGLDLQGGVRLVYQLDLSASADVDKAGAISSTRDVIERRVNTTGVAEPVIQSGKASGQETVIVELPGIKDVQEAINLIGQTAQLEFKEQDSRNPDQWINTGLTGKQLKNATVSFDPTTNAPQINLEFSSEGASLFEEITSRNVGKQVATFLDGEVLQIATVNEKIAGGQAVITGQFTIQEAKDLVSLLNAGALDVPIKLIEQRTVGATLGEQSVKNSLVAGVIGLLLVIIFMLVNYRVAGLAAVLALSGYAVIVVAMFKLIPVTITLSGIAGFILSIGMAVDANILIFERMREELRDGKNLSLAMEEGFTRAWPSVRDSNMATIITSGILFFTTTGLVRGFALTLALGVLVSLYSSITASRAFLRLFAMNKWLAKDMEKI